MFADLALHDERLTIAYEDAFEGSRALDIFDAAVLRDVLIIAATAMRAWFAWRR